MKYYFFKLKNIFFFTKTEYKCYKNSHKKIKYNFKK